MAVALDLRAQELKDGVLVILGDDWPARSCVSKREEQGTCSKTEDVSHHSTLEKGVSSSATFRRLMMTVGDYGEF